MIRYLIKNNVKLVLRNKWNIAIMILGPLLIIAILSSAFEDLMKSYETVDEFTVGYRISDRIIQEYFSEIKSAGMENGIILQEYPEGDIKELIENNDLAAFVEITEKNYKIHESADYEKEAVTLEYFLHQVMKQSMHYEMQQMTGTDGGKEENIHLPIKQIDYLKAIDSKDYYGIIYIVFFIWCGIVGMGNIFADEKKHQIELKFQVSSLSNVKLYFAKWISAVLATTLEMSITLILTVILFDIHWGNPLSSAAILLLSCMASSALGLMIYYVCNNLVITIVGVFVFAWFTGFFGGSFETYMFSSWSEQIKNASPIYHVNRVLVEYSCMGESSATGQCILYLVAISVICSGIAVIADSVRKRGRG